MVTEHQRPTCVGETVVHHSCEMVWNEQRKAYRCPLCGDTVRGTVAGYEREGWHSDVKADQESRRLKKARTVSVTLYLDTDAGMDDLAEASFWQRTVDRAPLSGETVCVVKQVDVER